MGKRLGSHGEGTWTVPGGHLEFGESFADTARREVLEETGVQIKNIRFGAVTNDFFDTLPSPLFLPWQQLLPSDFLDSIKSAL